MTTTSWQKLFGLGTAVALVAAACTVSSGSDDDDGQVTTGTTSNSGGTSADGGTGGTDATGGTAGNGGTGGSAGETTTTSTTTSTTGGSGGEPPEVDCLDTDSDTVPGDPAVCEVDDSTNCCTKCVAANCCEAYSNCFASDPFNICGGATDDDSEIFAFINCMVDIDGGATPGTGEDSDFERCIADATENVSAPVCGNGTISGPTNELATCIHGDADRFDGCFLECLTDFTGECAY